MIGDKFWCARREWIGEVRQQRAGGLCEIEKPVDRSISLEYLWSPWRMEYILRAKVNGCIFCEALERTDGAENLIVHRAQFGFVILNRFPYTSGHVMVVPYLHKTFLAELTSEIRSEIIELVDRAVQAVAAAYQPQGFNVGINIGEAAGAGVVDHIHMHVVPRWGGDTNVMSAVAGTRVLPENLVDSYARIKAAWNDLAASHL